MERSINRGKIKKREKRISESDELCNKVQRDSSQDLRHKDPGRLLRCSRT